MGSKRYIALVFAFFFSLFLSFSSSAYSDSGKDMIIVLDTSMSMTGKGSNNILPQVKESLYSFIEKMNEGDTFTFMTFDTIVRIYPTIELEDDNDKEILKKYISVVEAKGEWTYTMEMLKNVLKRAEELQKANPKRQQVLLIMTDALDDPPPAKRKEFLDIKDVAKKYQGKDWFIYFVTLKEAKENKNVEKVKKALKETVSPYTQEIKVTNSSKEELKKLIEKEIPVAVEKMAVEKKANEPILPVYMYFVIAGGIIFLLLIVLYIRSVAKIKLRGTLEYYDHSVASKFMEKIDLDSVNASKMRIGADFKDTVRLRSFDAKLPLILEAISLKGKVRIKIDSQNGAKYLPVKMKEELCLSDGDEFKVANYTFIYRQKADNIKKAG